MALPKIQEARALSDEELVKAITDTKRKLFELRLKKATGQELKPHEFKHNKHRLAQLMTVEKERASAAETKQGKTPALQTLPAETVAKTPEAQPEE